MNKLARENYKKELKIFKVIYKELKQHAKKNCLGKKQGSFISKKLDNCDFQISIKYKEEK